MDKKQFVKRIVERNKLERKKEVKKGNETKTG